MDEELIGIPEPDSLRQTGAPLRMPLLIIRILALAAAGVAGYLLIVSFRQHGLPLGCGQGSGCDEVLRSRWSSLFGVPIGALALAAYVAALIGSFLGAWRLLTLIAVSVIASAVWFVSLQLFVLHAVCPWCMADHALGAAMSGLILWTARLRTASASDYQPPKLMMPATAGLLAAGCLIALQIVFGSSTAAVARLPAGENADTGPGPDRQISVLSGKLVLDVRELPVLGSADAPKLIVLLFDYCCPHCRATHGYLLEGMSTYPGQYGVVLLPMPLDAKCNPTVGETERRFLESCDLARVALALWRTKPEAFADFDAWLYEPEMPRKLDEARARAAEVVSPASLDAALADAWIEARIAADVRAYAESAAQTLPVLLSPGVDTVVGRPESAEELFAILERELGLVPSVH
jgi:uncharacterized membrane protein